MLRSPLIWRCLGVPGNGGTLSRLPTRAEWGFSTKSKGFLPMSQADSDKVEIAFENAAANPTNNTAPATTNSVHLSNGHSYTFTFDTRRRHYNQLNTQTQKKRRLQRRLIPVMTATSATRMLAPSSNSQLPAVAVSSPPPISISPSALKSSIWTSRKTGLEAQFLKQRPFTFLLATLRYLEGANANGLCISASNNYSYAQLEALAAHESSLPVVASINKPGSKAVGIDAHPTAKALIERRIRRRVATLGSQADGAEVALLECLRFAVVRCHRAILTPRYVSVTSASDIVLRVRGNKYCGRQGLLRHRIGLRQGMGGRRRCAIELSALLSTLGWRKGKGGSKASSASVLFVDRLAALEARKTISQKGSSSTAPTANSSNATREEQALMSRCADKIKLRLDKNRASSHTGAHLFDDSMAVGIAFRKLARELRKLDI